MVLMGFSLVLNKFGKLVLEQDDYDPPILGLRSMKKTGMKKIESIGMLRNNRLLKILPSLPMSHSKKDRIRKIAERRGVPR